MFWVGEPQRRKSTCFENDSHTLLVPFAANTTTLENFPKNVDPVL